MASEKKSVGKARKNVKSKSATQSQSRVSQVDRRKSPPILRLPPEIVLLVADLLQVRDKLTFGRINRLFHGVINPLLYKHNVKSQVRRWAQRGRLPGVDEVLLTSCQNASCLFWGAENGQLGTLKHAFAAGANLDTLGPGYPFFTGRSSRDNEARSDGSDEDASSDEGDDISSMGGSDVHTAGNSDGSHSPSTQTDRRSNSPILLTIGAAEAWSTPLHAAAKAGHRHIVEWLLDQGVNMDAPSHKMCECRHNRVAGEAVSDEMEYPRWRALHTAMCNDESEVAELLIFRGASWILDARPGHNHSALHSAAANGLVPIIKLLAIEDINLDANQPDSAGNTPLHFLASLWAARDSAQIRDTIAKLLSLGADLEAHNKSGHTPLLYACHKGNYAAASRLVCVGAEPDPHRHVRDFKDVRPLYFCTIPRADFFKLDEAPVKHDDFAGNRVSLMHALLDAGADLEARYDKRDRKNATTLMLACELAEPRAVAALVERGASVNAQDRHGQTPLMYACTVRTDHRGEVHRIIQILVRRGARLDICQDGPDPRCPLDWAIKELSEGGDTGALDVMLTASGSVNIRQAKLRAAMQQCAAGGNHKALKLLLQFGDRTYGVGGEDLRAVMKPVIEIKRNDSCGSDVFYTVMDFGRLPWSRETLFLQALQHQNERLATAILNRGVSVSDVRLYDWSTYLHLACRWGEQTIVDLLLERGADVNAFDSQLRTPLSIAVQGDHGEIAVALLKEVAYPHLSPDEDFLQELVDGDHGEEQDWEYMIKKHLTAFELAIREDRVEILREMVARFALPAIPHGARFSYVHEACKHLSTSCLEVLLQGGADPNGGEACPVPPAVSMLRYMSRNPGDPELAATKLKMVKVLLQYPTAAARAKETLDTILSYEGDDADRRALSSLIRKEIEIVDEADDGRVVLFNVTGTEPKG